MKVFIFILIFCLSSLTVTNYFIFLYNLKLRKILKLFYKDYQRRNDYLGEVMTDEEFNNL